MSIVLRFVDNNCIIREEFLDFISTERITGEVLAHAIKESLNRFDLDIQNCRGQGYDSVSNMCSARGVQGVCKGCARGVQGRLLTENPKAMYIHCNSHVLNLCIVKACSLPPICNMNSTITGSEFFFQNSAKWQILLEKVIDRSTSIIKVKDLCRTRWIYQHEAYEDFHVLYQFLVCTIKAITDRDPTYGIMGCVWWLSSYALGLTTNGL